MNILERLKNQLKQRQKTNSTSAWTRYRDLLERIDRDEEFDIDDAQAILEAAGRTWTQLEDEDLPLFRRRKEWQSIVRQSEETGSAAQSAADESDRLEAEFTRVVEDFQSRIKAAREKRSALETIVDRGLFAVQQLRETVQDPSIRDRKAEIAIELKELVDEQAEIEEQVRGGNGSVAALMSVAVDRFNRWSDELRRDPRDPGGYVARQVSHWDEALDRLRNRSTSVEQEGAAIKQRISELHREIEKLDRESLQP